MMLIRIGASCCFSFLFYGLAFGEATFEIREKITYSTVGDRELLLDAFIPKEEGKYPAVLVVHGGAWRSGNRKQLRAYATTLAERGFVCFAIDYRLAPKHKFPAQIEDCRAAVKWIRENASQYKVNPKRVGAIGYSAGGHLVSLMATTGQPPSEASGNVDTRIQAAAAGGAPTDFRWFPDNGRWAEFWMGGDLSSKKEKFQAASSAAFVDAGDAPLFFFHGSADELVPEAWTKACYFQLKSAGVKTEFYSIANAGHMQAAMDPKALKKACDFLASELVRESTLGPSVERQTSRNSERVPNEEIAEEK
ncbi:alpha/beta hydrolase [Rhodopirellula sp.]|nr:alpha/beta hydrolase [Rhodopirellula sp.]